ncbi:methyltransferase domain-containing protein [Nocardioides sp. MAH-18]|uniref:Methyltransferase domain-containing protein n=1 Tax=Nocardioides agri TaxID=2682843 RepID=A0A6L6XX77_9ACTN|nr:MULTISPECIES: class I SAM-dependent methyltransferase [unclassified Nocardioides]MBA2952525.1 class I SAM-dependent methyltransferase [Nocardioides sp. CGMCC 1.13656]MVQ51688.1 methyltransferase domain-containing protein [Nocardioides sp. MAH-18]
MGSVGSPSITRPDHWWYRARAELLAAAVGAHVGTPATVLDVGSADGPSVGWLAAAAAHRVALDIDPRVLAPGDVRASAMQLPFADATFDVVAAFDVVEHCEPEAAVFAELARVLAPGGRLLVSVPAYQWAWSDFDVQNGHHRRYTRRRLVAAVERQDLEVVRATYIFAGTLPFFTADRLRSRMRSDPPPAEDGVPRLPDIGPGAERLLMAATGLDRRLLPRCNLPFGSSVVVVARKAQVA